MLFVMKLKCICLNLYEMQLVKHKWHLNIFVNAHNDDIAIGTFEILILNVISKHYI